MKDNQPKAIDLFCGCGGISEGLRAAGFDILAGVDIETKYLCSFAHNFGKERSFNLDLSQVKPQDFIKQIGINCESLDLLVGGPPCQGFSKNVPRKSRFLDDPKNKMVNIFLDYCEVLKPRMILMENVAEMKNGFGKAYSEEITVRLQQAGYTVAQSVLNAADYGIPQRRRRAFFVANKSGIHFRFPAPTHLMNSVSQGIFEQPQHVNVWDAIGDLPSLKHGVGKEDCEYASDPFSDFQRIMRKDNTAVSNHVARYLRPTQYQRLSSP